MTVYLVFQRYLPRWVKSHSRVFNFLKNCIARRIAEYLICYRCEVINNIRKATNQEFFLEWDQTFSSFNSTSTEFDLACNCKEKKLPDFVLSLLKTVRFKKNQRITWLEDSTLNFLKPISRSPLCDLYNIVFSRKNLLVRVMNFPVVPKRLHREPFSKTKIRGQRGTDVPSNPSKLRFK